MKYIIKIFVFVLIVSSVGFYNLTSEAKSTLDSSSLLLTNPYQAISKKDAKKIVPKAFNFPCGSFLTDRDGYSYKTVQIGNQCWMAENLKTKTRPDGKLLSVGFDTSDRDCITDHNTRGTERDCDARGALYALVGIYFDNDATQDICPTGWRTPNNIDLEYVEQLLKNPRATCEPQRSSREGATATGCRLSGPLDDCAGAGQKLKKGGSTGFDWQLSGARIFNVKSNSISFSGSNTEGYLWTRDHHFNYCGWNMGNFEYGIYHEVTNSSSGIIRDKTFVGEPLVGDLGITAMPMRCVKK